MGSPKPQRCSESRRIHKCTTEGNSWRLFQVKPDGERSVTGQPSCTLRNLLVSEAISNSLKSLLSFPTVRRLCPHRRQTGVVSGVPSAELTGGVTWQGEPAALLQCLWRTCEVLTGEQESKSSEQSCELWRRTFICFWVN